MVKQPTGTLAPLGFDEADRLLTSTFGSIGEPLTWFGVNEHSLKEALALLPHAIERKGIFSRLTPASTMLTVAYIVSRLIRNRDMERVPQFRADKKRFGIVAQVGTLASAEVLLGKTIADGEVNGEEGVLKAHFVSLEGLALTVRQCTESGVNSSFIVNTEGKAEMAVQELTAEARSVITKTIPTS